MAFRIAMMEFSGIKPLPPLWASLLNAGNSTLATGFDFCMVLHPDKPNKAKAATQITFFIDLYIGI